MFSCMAKRKEGIELRLERFPVRGINSYIADQRLAIDQ